MAKTAWTYDKLFRDWAAKFAGLYTEIELLTIHRQWRSLGKKAEKGRL